MSDQKAVGPLTYSGDEDGDFVIWKPDGEYLANVGAPFSPAGVVRGDIVAFDIRPEDQVYARLFAAAPELAEALEEYFSAMEAFAAAVRDDTQTPYPWEAQDLAVPKVRAALAKAKGGDA